jgi:hypothetical protein
MLDVQMCGYDVLIYFRYIVKFILLKANHRQSLQAAPDFPLQVVASLGGSL